MCLLPLSHRIAHPALLKQNVPSPSQQNHLMTPAAVAAQTTGQPRPRRASGARGLWVGFLRVPRARDCKPVMRGRDPVIRAITAVIRSVTPQVVDKDGPLCG